MLSLYSAYKKERFVQYLFYTLLQESFMRRIVTMLGMVVVLAVVINVSAFAQPRSLIVVNNNTTAPITNLQLGTTYSLRWDTTAAPLNARYRVQYSSVGASGPFENITVRNTSTQLAEPLIISDSAAITNSALAPGAGARWGRGISRLTVRLPRASQTGFIRLVNVADTSQTAVTGSLVIAPPPPAITVDSTLRGIIPAGTTVTLSNSKIYGLSGYVFVDSAAVLRILPGTVIVGDTAGRNSALCVNRGGILFARGTVENPIVMTSRSAAGQRRSGDWGGLLIAGRARINVPGGTSPFEGGIADDQSIRTRGWYGGTNDDDSSGVIEYVRVEFGGIAAFPNEELNGITLGGVGRKTIFRYVQSSFANDDGIEWFGGSVNGKYLIVNNAIDDDFDTDFGFSGRIQFGLGLRAPQTADQSTSQAFESDNDANSSTNTPLTSAIFSNMTLVGPLTDTSQIGGSGAGQWSTLFGNAAQIRRNSRQSIVNSVFIGWPRAGLEISGPRTQAAALADSSLFRNNTWYGVKAPVSVTFPVAAGETVPTGVNLGWITAPAFGNAVINGTGSVSSFAPFVNPQTLTNRLDPRPTASAPFVSTASFTRPANSAVAVDDAFFERVTYQGAFAPGAITNLWYLGWAEFEPNSVQYAANVTTRGRVTNVKEQVPSFKVLDVVTYPNPTTALATVRYNLPQAARVTISVVDAMGKVQGFVANNLEQSEGVYEFRIDASNFAPGTYIVQVATQNGTASQKLNVVR
jgi:Secretion system C-terminal sorting domain